MHGELCQSFSLLPRCSEPWIWISKPVKSGVKKFICRRSAPTGALSVKGPAKDELRGAIVFSSHPSKPMVDKRGLPTPAQATIVTTLTSLFAHARSRKAISSSRPKTSLPVTGSLAIEIFFGASLVGGLRIPTRGGVEGVFCSL